MIYPQHQPNAFRRTGRGKKGTKVRDISSVKKKGNKTMCNGIDVTDTRKYFSPKEYSKLGEEGRKYLNKCPKRKAFKENLANAKKTKTDVPQL